MTLTVSRVKDTITSRDDNKLSISSDDHWIQATWRPFMAWSYGVICVFDFLVAPILTGLYHFFTHTDYTPWQPITLGEGGFYHMAMMAIVGVTAWTRGQMLIKRSDTENNIENNGENTQ